MNRVFILLFFLLIIFINTTDAQDKITKEQALDFALENNFGIQVSRNNTEITKNNSNILNSGYLPTVSISGGGNYIGSDSEIAFPGQFDDQEILFLIGFLRVKNLNVIMQVSI